MAQKGVSPIKIFAARFGAELTDSEKPKIVNGITYRTNARIFARSDSRIRRMYISLILMCICGRAAIVHGHIFALMCGVRFLTEMLTD